MLSATKYRWISKNNDISDNSASAPSLNRVSMDAMVGYNVSERGGMSKKKYGGDLSASLSEPAWRMALS
jgi:hypothetical protein